MDFATPELIKEAQQQIVMSNEYKRLKEKYDKQQKMRQYIQASNTKRKIDELIKREAIRIANEKTEKELTTSKILNMLTDDDKAEYKIRLHVLCFCFDMMESAVMDINDILKRNGTGLISEQFPEIAECKKKVSTMLNKEVRGMNELEINAYINEADNLYSHLKARSGIYIRKHERLLERQKKDTQ